MTSLADFALFDLPSAARPRKGRPRRIAAASSAQASCWLCGKLLISHGAPRPTCTACRQKHGSGVCSKCGGPKRSDAPGMCRACRPARPKAVPGNCKLCGEFYVPRKAARPDQQWCSKSCAQAWRNGARPPYVKGAAAQETRALAQARARRLRHAQTWDGITDEEILERDGWRCQIPGCKRRPIRKDVKHPHPRSKSIDHVIPLSHGGDDTAVNKRAAHLGCNLARGNEMREEQVALFGVIREPPLATVTAGERAAMFQPKKRRLCACGTVPLKGSKFCQTCFDRRAAEIESRRAYPASPVCYYACRYCGELKVAHGQGRSRREVCPARPCQLARLMANNLRVRNGLSAEEADAQMAVLVAAGRSIRVAGRWRSGAAQRLG